MKFSLRLLSLLCLCFAAGAEDAALQPFRTASGKWGFAEATPGDDDWFGPRNWAKHGKIVVPAEYAWVGYFQSGVARVTKTGAFEGRAAEISDAKWGFIDATGKEVIAPQFSRADDFQGEYAMVEINDKLWGLINKKGAMVVPAKYESVNYFSDGLALVETPAGFGFCDRNGAERIAVRYENADSFREGRARVCRDGKFGWVDVDGTEFGFGKYEHIHGYCENLAGVQKDGKWGFADKLGDIAIAPAWDEVGTFCFGLARVKRGELWGFIDTTGKVAIEPKFNGVANFEKVGLAVVWHGREDMAFIRRDGTYAFPQRFKHANGFDADGKASVIFENAWWDIDVNGSMTRPERTGQWMSPGGNEEPSDGFSMLLRRSVARDEKKW